MCQELFWLIWSQEPWIQFVQVHSAKYSDQTTLCLVNQAPATTGPRVTTQKAPSWSTLFWTWWERRPNPATACRDFNWPTHWEAALAVVWALCWSPRSVKSTRTVSWTPSRLCHRQRSATLSSSLTMPLCLFISLLRIPMRPTALTTRRCMTFASEHWSSPPQPMAIWTIWSQQPCPVSLPAWDFRVNWTLIWESWPSTWSHFHVSTFSCQVSPHWHHVVRNNIALWLSLNWPNKCLMPRTWWPLAIQDTDATWLLPPFSVDACQWRKSMNKCWMFKIKTLHTLLNGNLLLIIFLVDLFINWFCLKDSKQYQNRCLRYSTKRIKNEWYIYW